MIRAEVWFSFADGGGLLAKRKLARATVGEGVRMEESLIDRLAGTCCMAFLFPSLTAWHAAKAALAAEGFRFKEAE